MLPSGNDFSLFTKNESYVSVLLHSLHVVIQWNQTLNLPLHVLSVSEYGYIYLGMYNTPVRKISATVDLLTHIYAK